MEAWHYLLDKEPFAQRCPNRAAVKRTEKAMRNKLSVQQGEEGDEEDGEVDHMAKDKQWGKSKRGYYGADTEEYEVCKT